MPGPTVGITTMHRINNYGSTLQAYALRRLIELGIPGSITSFIDFRPGPTLNPASAPKPTSSKFRALQKVREYNQVEAPLRDRVRFFNHKRRYGHKYLSELGITRESNFDTAVDVQVIGSDEVFNCVQSNSNVGFSPDLFGKGTRATRLVSYAGSFGNTTMEKIHHTGIADELAGYFRHFDRISVRDENSQKIVTELTGTKPPVHIDPVLAFDYMGEEPRIPTHRLHEKPYLIVYGYSGRLTTAENDDLRAYADSLDAEILSFGGLQASADAFIDCSPLELLAYFRDSLGVVTDTFHGAILSIINERPFCSIIRRSVGADYGNEEKIGHLLTSLDLASRRVNDATDLATLLRTPIDYATVNATLQFERSRTQNYLHDALHLEGVES